MTHPILVTSLQIEALSGSTCYEGENGFSSVTAIAKSDDPSLVAVLDQYVRSSEPTSLRCGLLEVFGALHSPRDGAEMKEYSIRIHALTYGSQAASESGA
jgi:hypothetical protein